MGKQAIELLVLSKKIDQLTEIFQNLFILQALSCGAKVNDIRRFLKIDKWRVSNVSKLIRDVK